MVFTSETFAVKVESAIYRNIGVMGNSNLTQYRSIFFYRCTYIVNQRVLVRVYRLNSLIRCNTCKSNDAMPQ